MKTRTTTTFAALAAASLAGVSAYAGTHTAPASKPIKEVLQESCITGDIGFDVVSNYVTKGIVLENQGFIIQPYANLHFRIAQNVGPITSITADIGIWNSFHDRNPLAGGATGVLPGPGGVISSTNNWFEFDFQAGFTFNVDRLALAPYFKVYESPSDVFQNTYVAGFNISYDDTDLLGDFAMHPYAFVELNMEGSTGNNFRSAGPIGTGTFHGRGQYYEIGLTPAHTWGDLTVSLPLKGGFGSGGFYLGNRTFGFFSVGIDAAYALNFVPECLGKWTVHSGVTYVRIGGDNTINPLNPAPNFGVSGAAGLAPAYLPGTGVAKNDQLVFGGGLKVAF